MLIHIIYAHNPIKLYIFLSLQLILLCIPSRSHYYSYICNHWLVLTALKLQKYNYAICIILRLPLLTQHNVLLMGSFSSYKCTQLPYQFSYWCSLELSRLGLLWTFSLFFWGFIFLNFLKFFIQLQLSAFSPHPSTPQATWDMWFYLSKIS